MAGVDRAAQASGSAGGVAGGGQARDPVYKPPQPDEHDREQSDVSALAPLLDGSTAGELIPELVRHGLQ